MDTYIINDLDTAKLLTDPFKLKLIEHFAAGPVTTKQVADDMGEKAPRLYRHVDALVEAGLLTLVEERPKRGTIERYYRTVASRFELNPELLSPRFEGDDEIANMLRGVIRDTESALLRSIAEHKPDACNKDELPLLAKFTMRGSRTEVAGMRQRLEDWLEDCKAMEAKGKQRRDGNGDADELSYAGLLTIFPRVEDE